MTAKEFLKQVSPNDEFGIRADLKAAKLEKHVIDIMERYAALRIHDVVERSEQLCQHDRSVTNRICDDCGSIITYVPDEEMREPIENALYATKRFLTTQATDLAEGILEYLKDAGFTIVRTDGKPPVIRRRHKWDNPNDKISATCIKCGCRRFAEDLQKSSALE